MMKKQYALMDTATGSFQNPIHCINHGDAIRLFTSWVNPSEGQQETNVSKYPQHFALYYMGDYDDTTGRFGHYDEKTGEWTDSYHPKEIIIGSAVKEEQEQKFTVRQLITMLETELRDRNVIQITDSQVREN